MTWDRLQSCSNFSAAGGGAGPLTVQYTASLSSGTKLIAVTTSYAPANGQCTAVSDGNGNGFTMVGDSGNPGAGYGGIRVWALDTPAGDVGAKPAVTASYDSTGIFAVLAQEAGGLCPGTTASLDGAPGILAGSTSSGSASSGTPSYASTAAGEYLASFFGLNTNGDSDPVLAGPSGYATDPSTLSGALHYSEVGVAYKSSTGGTEADGWGISGADGSFLGWGVVLVAFKLAAVPLTSAGQSCSPVPAIVTTF